MASGETSELAIVTVAALSGFVVAWWATRGHDDTRPGPAVRLYVALFRSTGVGKHRETADSHKKFPKREAFLASWFLTFFVIFMFGVLVWPTVKAM